MTPIDFFSRHQIYFVMKRDCKRDLDSFLNSLEKDDWFLMKNVFKIT